MPVLHQCNVYSNMHCYDSQHNFLFIFNTYTLSNKVSIKLITYEEHYAHIQYFISVLS